MKIFFDFDDVLFNTGKFKEDYFKIFKKYGVTKDIFDACYYDPLEKGEIKSYNPTGHIKRICEKVNMNKGAFEEDVALFLEDTSEYIFKDVLRVLSGFSPNQLAIVSFSKTQFQKAKIYNSGIFDFFGEIEVVDEMKGRIISEMVGNEGMCLGQKIFFVDDRIEQIEDVKKTHPSVITVLCSRKEGRYHDQKNKSCDYEVVDLRELKLIVGKLCPQEMIKLS